MNQMFPMDALTADKIRLCHIILCEFEQGRNAKEACRNLLKVFDEDRASDRSNRRTLLISHP